RSTGRHARRRHRRLRGGRARADPRRPGRQRRKNSAQARDPVIARLIAFALHQRFITLALALLLTVGGVVAWYRLPIEAYPDVADVQVDVITIWAGHAAEAVERLITIPIEKEVNGIAGITFLRSVSNFGLSNVRIVFSDGTDKYWSRQ